MNVVGRLGKHWREDSAIPPAPGPLGRVSLAARVVLLAAIVGAGVLALSAAVLFENARAAVAVETAAGQRIARDYALAVLGTLLTDHAPERAVALLPSVLTQPRHARIDLIDHHNVIAHVPERQHARAPAPEWFAARLRPQPREIVIPIRAAGRGYGRIVITPDPSDEIDEAWEDVSTLALLAAAAYLAGLAALGLLVRRALRPLRRMAAAFDRLETGDYAARVGPVGVPELHSLAERFDRLGAALAAAFAEKDALNRSLLDVQDAERKAVALELHDEFGPCLFGLRVEARAILSAAEARGDADGAERARAIAAIVEQIQDANRALLDRLRPMELGELPLAQVLDDLVAQLAGLGEDIAWTVTISPALTGYDETSELTIYRVLQEAITNALRHAEAAAITVAVAPLAARPDVVEIVVEDDGRGVAAPRPGGLGLKGMAERAAAVGGTFVLRDRPGGGTVLRATVPVRAARPEADS